MPHARGPGALLSIYYQLSLVLLLTLGLSLSSLHKMLPFNLACYYPKPIFDLMLIPNSPDFFFHPNSELALLLTEFLVEIQHLQLRGQVFSSSL